MSVFVCLRVEMPISLLMEQLKFIFTAFEGELFEGLGVSYYIIIIFFEYVFVKALWVPDKKMTCFWNMSFFVSYKNPEVVFC